MFTFTKTRLLFKLKHYSKEGYRGIPHSPFLLARFVTLNVTLPGHRCLCFLPPCRAFIYPLPSYKGVVMRGGGHLGWVITQGIVDLMCIIMFVLFSLDLIYRPCLSHNAPSHNYIICLYALIFYQIFVFMIN